MKLVLKVVTCVVIPSLLLVFTSCGTPLFSKKTRTSKGSSNNSLFSSNAQSKHSYKPITGRMDGVEYVINKNLMKNRVESRFPELKSAFDSSARSWRPKKGYNIPIVRNAKVNKWIRTFTGPLRRNFARWLKRTGYYAPLIQKILRQEGVPTDLLYLAMIESGFNLNAYSHAHAAGPWQFIRRTGRLYGLKSGRLVDERRDIVKSTRAAARHLKDLHKLYKDWYLAFAAYNAGAGKVNGAIRRSKTRNYWKMTAGRRRYLRNETKNYVPKILAAAIITKNYRKYGFSSRIFEKPLNIEPVTVPGATDMTVVAKCAGASTDEILFLNPSMVLGVTPPRQRTTVYVPEGSASNFKKNYSKIPKSERVQFGFHKVKRRETLSRVARRYGVSVRKLARANKLSTRSRIRRGTLLVIPKKISASSLFAKHTPSSRTTVAKSSSGGTYKTYRVRQGDTLGKISKRYGVSVHSLKTWNGLSRRGFIKAGQKLRVSRITKPKPAVKPAPTAVASTKNVYRVRRGDTLGTIAKRHGVSIASLKRWNKIGSRNLIWPGQKLRLKSSKPVATASKTSPEKKTPAVQPKNTTVIIHAVRRGETLWGVSKKYNVSINQLKSWNGLQNNQLYPNQKLKIYSPAKPKATAERVALAK